MSLSTLRLSHSSFCELSCGYCKLTQSKTTATTTDVRAWPKNLPPARRLVVPCNSFYRTDLEEHLQKVQDDYESIFIEFNFLTLALERNHTRLQALHTANYQWIVHIDHLDEEKISALKIWDDKVSEYRILPSQLYPAALFLKQLPDFVQKKLKWQFMRKDDDLKGLLALGDLPDLLTQLRKSPLHSLSLSENHWSNTVSENAPLITTEHAQWIDRRYYKNSDWPLHLAQATTSYVGTLSVGHEKLVNDLLTKTDSLVLALRPHQHDNSLQFLENTLVKKELWTYYLKTYSAYNHWTWTDFIKNQNIQVQTVIVPGIESQITSQTLRQESQNHFLSTLDEKFYKKYFFLLHDYGFVSRLAFSFFSFVFSLSTAVPYTYKHKVTRSARAFRMFTENLLYTWGLLAQAGKKVLLYFFNRSFWGAHHKYWQSYSLMRVLTGNAFAVSIKVYWVNHVLTQRFIWWTNNQLWKLYPPIKNSIGFSVAIAVRTYWILHVFTKRCLLWGNSLFWKLYSISKSTSGLTVAIGVRSYWRLNVFTKSCIWWAYQKMWQSTEIFWALTEVFWFLAEGFWKLTEVFWFVTEIFWKLSEVFWFMSEGFWWLYARAIAPTIGFLISLFDFPPWYAQEPFFTRWRLRATFFAKKWGWLVLKALRLK